MFRSFLGLKDNPFKHGFDRACLFMGRHHEEALAHLRYAVAEREGFAVITGAHGAGKSTVCRAFVEFLASEASVAFLAGPIKSPRDLLQRINRCFGLPAQAPTPLELTQTLNLFLMRQRVSGRKVVLFIDDAQLLSPEVLEQVRLISNLETNRDKLIQIVLIGTPELMQMLSSRQLRQMGQRVSVFYDIGPLTADETAAYIHHRLSVAASDAPIRFSAAAIRHIFKHTQGRPGRINRIGGSILAAAGQARQKEITGAVAQAVIRAIERPEGRASSARASMRLPAGALTCLGLLVLGAGVFLAWRPSGVHLYAPAVDETVMELAPAPESPDRPSAPIAEAKTAAPPSGTAPPSPATSVEQTLAVAGGAQTPPLSYSVQVGAYLQAENAQQAAAQLSAKGYPARVQKITDARGRVWHTVCFGDHPCREAAQTQADDFSRREQRPSVVVLLTKKCRLGKEKMSRCAGFFDSF
jgi:general secretion pathway protein A